MKKISKKEAQNKISTFFKNILEKTSFDIKKIKRLAANNNLKIKEERKLFCKKCLKPFNYPSIRIRKGKKIIRCPHCGFASRIKIISFSQ